ncbi:MAG: hypothetical protein ABIQ08_11800 [Duganella sp.]
MKILGLSGSLRAASESLISWRIFGVVRACGWMRVLMLSNVPVTCCNGWASAAGSPRSARQARPWRGTKACCDEEHDRTKLDTYPEVKPISDKRYHLESCKISLFCLVRAIFKITIKPTPEGDGMLSLKIGSSLCIFYCSLAMANEDLSTTVLLAHVDKKNIEKSISGNVSSGYRHQLASQMERMLDFARDPRKITLANISDHIYGDFNQKHCEVKATGIKVCVHTDGRYPYKAIRITELETHSKIEESDHGAIITWDLNPKYGCFPANEFSKIFESKPNQVRIPMSDPFISKNYIPPTVVEFRNFNPRLPAVYVQMRSSSGCVASITLSSILKSN